MNRHRLFRRTYWRLAGLYTGVMALILLGCGVTLYHWLAYARHQTLDREIASVAGTLHDSIEPLLKRADRLEPEIIALVPGLCVVAAGCPQPAAIERIHILGTVPQKGYYVRFFDRQGALLAIAGLTREQLPVQTPDTGWQMQRSAGGDRYRQMTLLLKTRTGRSWGYMVVGRSLAEVERDIITLRTWLLLGLPVGLLLIGSASVWLARVAMQPVYRSYEQIQQFTADAAHELRTPLAAIRATVESTLQTPDLSGESRSALETVQRQNRRLALLVQDLLFLSRLDLQGLPVKLERCHLSEILADLVEEFAEMAIAAEVELQLQSQTSEAVVIGSADQLYRLFTNLIVNAIQYTPPGGQVTVSLETLDSCALVQVRDTGIGIAPENLPHIFDRFYRVGGDRSRKTGGAGLGLAIARAITELHQGALQVHSQPAQGATFSVRLPLAPAVET